MKLLLIYVIYVTIHLFVQRRNQGSNEHLRWRFFKLWLTTFSSWPLLHRFSFWIFIEILAKPVECLQESWPHLFCVVYWCHLIKFRSFLQSVSFNYFMFSHFSLVSFNFVTAALLIRFLYWYSHFCENEKLKLTNLITVAAFSCKYVTDKNIVERFYK